MWSGRSASGDLGDRRLAHTPPNDAVVVEHRDAVGGDPDVALETGRTEASGQREGLDRVLRGVGARPTMGEGEWGIEVGGEPLLHSRS